jgi:hypothetical protein
LSICQSASSASGRAPAMASASSATCSSMVGASDAALPAKQTRHTLMPWSQQTTPCNTPWLQRIHVGRLRECIPAGPKASSISFWCSQCA